MEGDSHMNVRLKRMVTGASVLAVTTGGLLFGAGTAFAAPSPWEPDPNSLGSIVFYDAAGNVITGGSNLAHLADYYATTNNTGTAGIKATLYLAAPNHLQPTSLWFAQQQSASTTYPNAAAPAPLTGPGFVNPLVTATAADGNLTNFLAAATLDSTAGYVNIIQVRIKTNTSAAGKYWESNISYNAAAGTWSMNDPTVQATTTSLSATPPSPQTAPASPVTLNAVVAPASNGTVKFMEGATQLGTTQTVTTASGAASVNIGAPANGDHPYTAVFTPDGGTLVSGSTSSTLLYHVGAPLIGTTTTLAVNVGTGVAGSPVAFTSNVTTADSTTQTGTVTFKEGATTLGTSPSGPSSAPYTFTTSALTAGSHTVTATFNAPAGYSSSTSAPQTFSLTAPACPAGTCDAQTITADISAGTIVIATPYTAAAPLDVPLTLDPTASFYSGSAAFNGIHVTDTRAGNLSWDLKAQSSSLTFGANAINGQNVGLTALAVDAAATNTVSQAAGNLTVTNFPAASPIVTNPADPGALGLGGAQHTLVHANAGLGTITYKGTLTINAPTNVPAGTYTGTITFTVG
jgi:hypothetical protein